MEQQHFLVATFPAQGHINPALHLAKRLARTTAAAVTFSTTVYAHRRMFPSSAAPEVDDGLLTYSPFSDENDDLSKSSMSDFMVQFNLAAPRNFSALVQDLAARGRRVTCVVYTFLLSWAADVAQELGVPSAMYWIQPATVFALYHHYFHGYEELISGHSKDPHFVVDLPGLPPFRVRDLPSFFRISDPNSPDVTVLPVIKEAFDTLDRARDQTGQKRPKVLVNTSAELEADAITSVADKFELIPVGPVLPSPEDSGGDLFKPDEKAYMEWLDSKPEKSVVYVSFGSTTKSNKEQTEEILKGLTESGRPYLWVVRKDCRWEGDGLENVGGEEGMVVEWCSQVKVLSHPSVGCFVTHCGWNSMTESLVCGVPTVGVPQWSDQATNARMAEKEWGTGVRVEVNEEGILEGGELARCLELVMGEGERGREMRRKAEMWRERARAAVAEGGSSDRNLKAFVEEMVAKCG